MNTQNKFNLLSNAFLSALPGLIHDINTSNIVGKRTIKPCRSVNVANNNSTEEHKKHTDYTSDYTQTILSSVIVDYSGWD